MSPRKVLLLAVIAVSTAILAASSVGAQDQEKVDERYNGLALHLGTGPSGQVPIVIGIDRWSTEEEAQKLMATLENEDHQAFKSALDHEKETGYIRFPTIRSRFPSTEMNFARQYESNGKRVIVMATNRPLAIWGVWNQQRSTDFDITLIELRLDADGSGEGVLAVGVEFGYDMDKKQIVAKNWSSSPVQLKEIKKDH
ncbi:MAG: hypothetical protein PVJ49_05810 [Acidobacteriota bacterium]|jgi:hypothetical protein